MLGVPQPKMGYLLVTPATEGQGQEESTRTAVCASYVEILAMSAAKRAAYSVSIWDVVRLCLFGSSDCSEAPAPNKPPLTEASANAYLHSASVHPSYLLYRLSP
jgi:hypothetical protein